MSAHVPFTLALLRWLVIIPICSRIFVLLFSINAASKNKDAAKAFLEWAAEPEQTKAFAEIDGALRRGLQPVDVVRDAGVDAGLLGTTAPDASTSTLRRPPDMSFTRLAKSLQNSWKMSRLGQVDWNFQVAVWARDTWGAATVPAAR